MSDTIQDGVYRSEDYGFSIRFPAGWELRPGDGKNVVKQAFGPNRTGMNVVVTTSEGRAGEADFADFFQSMEAALLRQLAGRLLQKSVGEINGEQVGYMKIAAVLKTPNGNVDMIVQACLARKGGIQYMLSAMAPADGFDDVNPVITDSFATFTLENR
ncbi:hypothetical protein ACFL2T_06280 [Elusimicrobiota bacterium]